MREPGAGSGPPDPSELPRFAPVVDSDDDADGGRDGGDFDIDRGLLRVIGVIVLLAIVIAVLVLPPVSLLARGDGTSSSIVTRARESIPELPDGIVALSALYDIEVPASLAGAATLTVKLSEQIGDVENLAFYTYRGDRWTRLASATAVDGGRAAQGELDAVPSTIAVLRRVALARSLGLIVDAGEAPDRSASGTSIVSVLAAGPALEGDETAGSLSYDPTALGAARAAGSAAVYLGLSAPAGAPAEAVDRMLGTPSLSDAHVEDIVAAATRTEAAGVHLDYLSVDPARRTPFTSFVRNLAQALAARSMGLVVGVPTPPSAAAGSDGHAYDWAALAEAADVLWLRPPADPASYYEQLEAVLEAHRGEGVDLGDVSLVVDRYSRERSAGGLTPISLREAMTLASSLRTRLDDGISPGDAVAISGVNIDQEAGNTGMQWDERARAVSFAYTGRDGRHSVWIENRFSTAFRLDLARRFGLGGAVVNAAAADEALPNIWNTVSTFVEEGSARLELPYGPYLEPRWQASRGEIEGGESGVIVWRAPQQDPEQVGVYDITLIVSDGVVFVGQQISLRVAARAEEPAPQPAQPSAPTTNEQPAQQRTAESNEEAVTETPPAPTATPTPTPTGTPTPAPAPTPAPTPTPTPAPTPTPSGPPGPAGN